MKMKNQKERVMSELKVTEMKDFMAKFPDAESLLVHDTVRVVEDALQNGESSAKMRVRWNQGCVPDVIMERVRRIYLDAGWGDLVYRKSQDMGGAHTYIELKPPVDSEYKVPNRIDLFKDT